MTYISKHEDDSILVRLHVQPKAAKTRIVGMHDGCLKVAVASPPVDGKANKEILKFLAKLFSLGKTQISIKAGAHSRRKSIIVHGMSLSRARSVVEKQLDKAK